MRFFALFALLALAEMATFFWVESRIGLGWALGLAFATAVIGSVLVRRSGVSVLGRIQNKVGHGELPGRELGDGAAILVAGAFLISPGFITDALGFLLLVPVVRDLIYKVFTRRFRGRMTVFTTGRPRLRQDLGGGPSYRYDEVIDVEGDELE